MARYTDPRHAFEAVRQRIAATAGENDLAGVAVADSRLDPSGRVAHRCDHVQERLPGRSVSLQNEHREDGSWLHLDASLERDGTLQVTGQDLGPVTRNISPDGEYEYFYTIAAEDVPALVVALGGQPGTDVIDLLEERWSGDAAAYKLGGAISSSGVTFSFSSYP
jgi:hypothetical protein